MLTCPHMTSCCACVPGLPRLKLWPTRTTRRRGSCRGSSSSSSSSSRVHPSFRESSNSDSQPSSLPEPSIDDVKSTKTTTTSPKPPAKVHHTTVCAVPTPMHEEAWCKCQELRKRLKDSGLYRWPPHCNLVYPFVNANQFDEHVPALAEALSNMDAFDAKLTAPGVFYHKSGRATLFLRPEPIESFQMLQAKLQGAVPFCHEQTSNHGGVFTPHLTIAHFDSHDDAREAEASLIAEGPFPIHWRVGEIFLLSRDGPDAQFGVRRAISLRGDNESALLSNVCGTKVTVFGDIVDESNESISPRHVAVDASHGARVYSRTDAWRELPTLADENEKTTLVTDEEEHMRLCLARRMRTKNPPLAGMPSRELCDSWGVETRQAKKRNRRGRRRGGRSRSPTPPETAAGDNA